MPERSPASVLTSRRNAAMHAPTLDSPTFCSHLQTLLCPSISTSQLPSRFLLPGTMARTAFVALACGMLSTAAALKVVTPSEGEIVVSSR